MYGIHLVLVGRIRDTDPITSTSFVQKGQAQGLYVMDKEVMHHSDASVTKAKATKSSSNN